MNDDSDELLDLFLGIDPAQRKKLFLDTREAALWCGVSRRTIQVWAKANVIAAIRVGRNVVVHLPSLRDYLYRQRY